MSKGRKIKHLPLRRGRHEKEEVGSVDVCQTALTQLYDNVLADMVIVPLVERDDDGNKRVTGWFLTNNWRTDNAQNSK